MVEGEGLCLCWGFGNFIYCNIKFVCLQIGGECGLVGVDEVYFEVECVFEIVSYVYVIVLQFVGGIVKCQWCVIVWYVYFQFIVVFDGLYIVCLGVVGYYCQCQCQFYCQFYFVIFKVIVFYVRVIGCISYSICSVSQGIYFIFKYWDI